MNNAASRLLDTIEDHAVLVSFLEELCLYRDGKAGKPVIHHTHDSCLMVYMEKIADSVRA